MREIYDGSITVNADGYTHTVERGDDWVEVEIEGLDERITRNAILTFELDYPFEKPYEGTIGTDAGARLRQIIDAIRAAYRTMYRGASIEDSPNLVNKRVQGDYGEAIHAIDDLVIEGIAVDDETGELEIIIGS